MARASREEVETLRAEMVRADVALFTGLGHYWTGMAQILSAELEDNESDGFKKAAVIVAEAVERIKIVRQHEERILAVAQPIEYSAFFVRQHEVASQFTEALLRGLEAMERDLADGFYPAAACDILNRVLTRMMANFEQDGRIEGVLTRFQFGKAVQDAGSQGGNSTNTSTANSGDQGK